MGADCEACCSNPDKVAPEELSAMTPLKKPITKEAPVTIYGDYFNQDTRALLIICKLADLRVNFHLIDTFNGDHKTAFYKKLNPNQSIPMLQEGMAKVMSGTSMYYYMINTKPKVKELLFVEE